VPTGALKPGQVGYFLSNMKSVSDAHVGDTFHKELDKVTPFPGYDLPLNVVFAGIYPEHVDDYDELNKSLQ
jgi:translation factor GUF1, mitochondrial